MEYYSAIKRNEIESFVETWMDLETVIQSEGCNQRDKESPHGEGELEHWVKERIHTNIEGREFLAGETVRTGHRSSRRAAILEGLHGGPYG